MKRIAVAGAAICALAASVYYGVAAWRLYHPEPAPILAEEKQRPAASRAAMEPGAVMRSIAEIGKAASVTDDQKDRIRKLMGDSQADPAAFRQAVEQVLTPDQKNIVRREIASRLARMDSRAGRVLPPDQLKRYQEKRAQRFSQPSSGAPRDVFKARLCV